MNLLFGLVIYGVLAVVLALLFLWQRDIANRDAHWPDDNAVEDEVARRNVLRVLTLGLTAFAVVSAVLHISHGGMFIYLPIAAIALISVAAVRIKMRAASDQDPSGQRHW